MTDDIFAPTTARERTIGLRLAVVLLPLAMVGSIAFVASACWSRDVARVVLASVQLTILPLWWRWFRSIARELSRRRMLRQRGDDAA